MSLYKEHRLDYTIEMIERHDKKIAEEIIKLRFAQIVVNEEYKAGKFKVPIHLALGHESIAVALNNIMKENDKLILTHRNIAYNLARSNSLKTILNEYLLKNDGIMGGKLGSMNLINPNKGIIYSSSILGNNFSVAVGVALAEKMLGKCGLTIVLGGDGSIEEGSFYESLIMFKTLNLSALIIIENNDWSMSTKIDERRIQIDLAKIAESLGIKYVKLSGNNPFEYISQLSKLRDLSLTNNMPICIEILVSTMGDWIMKNQEYPDGKFINYHAGPAPNIHLKEWPMPLRNTDEDPIFSLKRHFDDEEFQNMTTLVREEIEKELEIY